MNLTLTGALQQIKFANFLKVNNWLKEKKLPCVFPLLNLIIKLKQLKPNFNKQLLDYVENDFFFNL